MIYLNNAATSWPKPSSVKEAVQACLTDTPASQFRGGSNILNKDIQQQCREALSRLFKIDDPSGIFFTSGATESLNTVLCGMDYGETGRGVLVTQTEHNSVLRPLMNVVARKGHPITVVPCTHSGVVTEEALVKSWEKATQRGAAPAALVVNHCSNVTGAIQDMEMVGRFAKKKGIFLVVDVSQSAGCIPVDVGKWKADAVIFTGHKSLLGMQGTGGFYVRESFALKPLKYGGTGRNSAQLTYENKDYEYEVGTQNLPGIRSLLAGVEFIQKIGVDQIQEKETKLMQLLYDGLEQESEIILYGDRRNCKGPVLSLNFRGLKASDAAYILENEYGIVVRAGLHCSPLIHQAMNTENGGTVRASVSYFTTEEEIRNFVDAAREISASICASHK